MSENTERQIAALREFKRAALEAAQVASVESGLDLNFDGVSEWIPWDHMTNVEKEEYPEAQPDGGFFRIGVQVYGSLNL